MQPHKIMNFKGEDFYTSGVFFVIILLDLPVPVPRFTLLLFRSDAGFLFFWSFRHNPIGTSNFMEKAKFLDPSIGLDEIVTLHYGLSQWFYSPGRGVCIMPPRPRGREATGTLFKVAKRPRPRSQPIIPRNTN